MVPAASAGPILIVDDDKKTAALIALYLEREGFTTISAHDGREALESARRHRPIFVVLDLMLPITDGWEVCQELRRSSDVPILMLTARDEEQDCLLGLSMGADDFVVKPFSPREVTARVKAILRRRRSEFPRGRGRLEHAGLVLDPENRTATLNGRRLALTASEWKILHALMAAPGRVFLRDEILNHLYPVGSAVIDRVVDVHIGKLRQKIEDDPANPRRVLTVRGLGYYYAEVED